MAKANLKQFMLMLPMLALCLVISMYLSPMALATKEDLLFINYHIHIVNDLPSDLPPDVPYLYLHCASQTKDLEKKWLLKHQDYTFDSKIDLLRTVVYGCLVSWEGKKMQFEAFKASRDEHRCRKYHNSCIWSVRDDGVYFSKDNATWYNQYPW